MRRNVEIKARVSDPPALAARAAEVATSGPEELVQHDVFFACRRGRLKLRRFADGRGELIAYQRADDRGPKTSTYRLVPVADPEAVTAALSASLGVLGEVRKTRTLWLAGRTRIHLDEVEGLGHFVELEVVLDPGDKDPGNEESDAEREAADLMATLGIRQADLVSGAYIDLLLRDST